MQISRGIAPLLFLLVASAPAGAQSADPGRLDVRPGSKVWIEGGSNLRDWSCAASTFEAIVDIDPAAHPHDAAPTAVDLIRRLTVKVAVRDLKCGNKRMEKDLYAALKADDPSTPSNILGIFTASRSSGSQESTLETEGTVAVAGVEKGVRTRITLERMTDGTVKAKGSVPLLMTDFGVKPPTGMLGLVRSHNEVTVKFELIIADHVGPRVAIR